MTECRDCHLKNLEWGKTKDGKPMLYEVRRIPHFAVCKAKTRQGKVPGAAKNGSRGPSVPGKPGFKGALGLLIDMNYKRAEAKELLRDIPEGPAETMVLAALKRKGEE